MTLYSAMKRKSERERVALLFEAMATHVDATTERSSSTLTPRGITLYLRKDGAAVMLHLIGANDLDAFIGHWHFDDRRGRLFAEGFDGHGYKPHHKATMMAETAEDLCARLEGAFLRVADGTAFAAPIAQDTYFGPVYPLDD